MHLGQRPCASCDRCGLLVVVVVRTWVYPSVDGDVVSVRRIKHKSLMLMTIPSCLSHLCCPHPDQLLRGWTVGFPEIGCQYCPRGRKHQDHTILLSVLSIHFSNRLKGVLNQKLIRVALGMKLRLLGERELMCCL